MKKTIRDFDLNEKTVILRCDFNVSMKNNKIIDDTKIEESLPTINYLLKNNAKVVILSHLGKIKKETDKKTNSLKPIYKKLQKHFGNKIAFVSHTTSNVKDIIKKMPYGNCLLLENTRFYDLDNKKESNCDLSLAKYWASLGDIFINDAFATIHRRHASNYGISKYLDSGIGFLVEKEIKNLEVLDNPLKPFAIIMGGSKVSDKIKTINGLIDKIDYLFIGGAMSLTFLKSLGMDVGSSKIEEDMLDVCKTLLTKYVNKIILPVDYYGSKKFSNLTKKELYYITDITNDFIAMDIGRQTIDVFKNQLEEVKTVFINGPLGVYEFSKYGLGTKEILDVITKIDTSIVGGGDIIACLKRNKLDKKVTFVSTGGGATLEYIADKNQPGLINIKEI